MLTIVVPESEIFNELTGEFITTPAQKLDLEHSLISLSRWESKWHKPFLTKEERTEAETLDYIRCMTITKNVDPKVYFAITPENISEIKKYIDDQHAPRQHVDTYNCNANDSRKSRRSEPTGFIHYCTRASIYDIHMQSATRSGQRCHGLDARAGRLCADYRSR